MGLEFGFRVLTNHRLQFQQLCKPLQCRSMHSWLRPQQLPHFWHLLLPLHLVPFVSRIHANLLAKLLILKLSWTKSLTIYTYSIVRLQLIMKSPSSSPYIWLMATQSPGIRHSRTQHLTFCMTSIYSLRTSDITLATRISSPWPIAKLRPCTKLAHVLPMPHIFISLWFTLIGLTSPRSPPSKKDLKTKFMIF